ncbi:MULTISPECIES: hypothetical protein [unclassified Marinobacter]|uniref:hypothetical protein n=1 Tax=unclassified Marinobacter TaxID=83889 RepID=UPI001927C3E4|nr:MULTISPECIES: hypothetical protein [unclassified Marinobacter]MBL3825163.1 hypothetical protein [Marinobacter sp. MC3]MBL3893633.1 hypothetical protein [Marinobacter sp. MW3]
MPMKIEYVGRQAPHRERLYGTKTLFSGPGDVQELADDVGRKMVTNHPDQYAVAGSKPAAATPSEPSSATGGEPVAQAATGQETENQPAAGTEPEPFLDREILVNGEYKALDKCTKQELEDFAKANFGVDLDRRQKVADLAVEVAGLIAKAEQEG